MSIRYKKTTSDFIKEAKAIHGNKYDYSKSEYTGASDKITITCKEHGDFQIRAVAHILKSKKASGCKKCVRHMLSIWSSCDGNAMVFR